MKSITSHRMLKIPFLNDNHQRTYTIKKNITYSFILQATSTILAFIQIPLILGYVDQTSYGIWLTLTSLLSFMYLLDIGIGYGLRNRFAESVAQGKLRLARVYVSTTYILGIILIVVVVVIFILIHPLVNWAKIFNAPKELASQVSSLAAYAFCMFCLFLVLKLITTILIALQKPALYNLQLTLTSLINLFFVVILLKTTKPSLLNLGIALSLSPLIVLAVYSIYFFRGPLRTFAPSVKLASIYAGKRLVGLGAKFLVIQMASVMIFQTHNILISHFLSPAMVTPYNIAFRYFGIANLGFSIIMLPFWSAFTEAYVKGDIGWIRSSINGLIKLWILFVGILLFLLVVSKVFFHIWLGDKVHIPFSLSISLLIYYSIYLWGSIFISFINGVGKIDLQFYAAIICILINIPLAYLFAKVLGLGLIGIVITSCIMNIYGLLLAPIQTLKILKDKTISSRAIELPIAG
jgi:O-antigen/teichoic acid export membrane protein